MVFMKVRNNVFCRIGGDWGLLCAFHELVKGHAIKLTVTGDARDCIVHVRHVPLQCIHRGFARSINTAEARHVYQVNHYFMDRPLHNKCGAV